MSGVLKKEPPMPKWHGMPPDLVDQYLAFARRYQTESVATRRRKVEGRIADLGYSRQDVANCIKRYREQVAETTELVAQWKQKLTLLSDFGPHEEGLLHLMDQPYFLGLRVNSAGRLVLHLRGYKEEKGESRYVGDFEFDLDTLKAADTLVFTQTDITERAYAASPANFYSTTNGIIQSVLYVYCRSYWELLRDGDFCGLAYALIKDVCLPATPKAHLGLDTVEPEPAWQGVAPGVERALARTLDFLVHAEARNSLAEAQENLVTYKSQQKRYTDKLRSLNKELAEARAELKQLQAQVDNPVFNEEAAREELRYMTSLPGVMGVKFEDVANRGVVPVFHVRTTMVHQGQRYDMGDYELALCRHHGESAAVIVTRQTRTARSGIGGLYYHSIGYSYGCWCCERLSWFCFGDRARELTQMFEQGDFGTFLHLAINSMNAVNDRDIGYYTLSEYFVKIDDDAVWKPRALTARRRPRRRWLASVANTVL